MREIVFKGYAKSDGRFLLGQLIRVEDEEGAKWFLCDGNVCLSPETEVDYKTLRQFTGEEDVVGMPIYEGDQLIVFNQYEPIEKARVVKVVWDASYPGFSVSPRIPECAGLSSVMDNYGIVVVMCSIDTKSDGGEE